MIPLNTLLLLAHDNGFAESEFVFRGYSHGTMAFRLDSILQTFYRITPCRHPCVKFLLQVPVPIRQPISHSRAIHSLALSDRYGLVRLTDMIL